MADSGFPFQRGGGRRERVTTADSDFPFQRGRRGRVSTDGGGDNI